MAQISLTPITSAWSELTPTASTVYRIQNRGPEVVIAQEADSEPAEDNIAGVVIYPGKTCVYEKGTAAALFMRTLEGNATVNISTEA